MLHILFGVFLGVIIYYKVMKPLNYWEEQGVVNEQPSWPIVGNMGRNLLGKAHAVDIVKDVYNKHTGHRYVGFKQYTLPVLVLRDINLIKQITVKNFDHFHDHFSAFPNNENDPLLTKRLICLTGEKWKQMQSTLSPAFTSTKMENMYHLINECAKIFVNYFKRKEQVAVEMKDIFSRFATDVIATTAFGVTVNSLNESNNNFFNMSKRLNFFGITTLIRIILLTMFPTLAEKMGIRLFPKDVTHLFRSKIKDNINRREKKNIIRPDLIHLLMEARKGLLKQEADKERKEERFATVEECHSGTKNDKMELSDDHIVAQAVLFLFAGFDTAATASSFMAYELAVNPDVQKKLQKEIDAAYQEYNGYVPCEILLSMKYLDQVLCETLRMWPPDFHINPVCTKDYTIPPKSSKERQIVIKRGIPVLIPVMAIHRDARYYVEPDRFDPDRFSDENKSKIVPGTYLPLGAGPKNCFGSKFALLEVKILFFHLLSKFDIVPINDTQIPPKISPKQIKLAPKNGFRLAVRSRDVIF